VLRIVPNIRAMIRQIPHLARQPSIHPIPKTSEIRHRIRRRDTGQSETALRR
jgi:hypothetical protein